MENGKYFINTYGCQMNIHESEKMAGILRNFGYIECEKQEEADVIVFNTCSIRETAELKIYGNIGAIKPLKKKNPNILVIVAGCMSQQPSAVEKLKKTYPFVDIVLGTHNTDLLGDYLKKHQETQKRVFEVWEKEGQIFEKTPIYRTSRYNAWVNIMYGCNNFCTYCIVPYVRGRERSRKPEDIIEEVKDLVQNKGYKIITLLGQNVNSYGNDFENKDINFVSLLKELVKIEGKFKIKFLTSHPKDFSKELVDLIAKEDKISKAIHLPVQSGSNEILNAMNRRYTVEHYKEMITYAREKIKDCTFSTDIIVGFPNETEEDFEKTCDLLRFCKYSSIFGFMYSKRKGTIAEKMEGQVPIEIKRKRVNKLFEVEKEITAELVKELIGKKLEVIIDEKKGNLYIGKTDNGKTIEIKNDNLNIGEFYMVVVTKLKANSLVGEILEEV